MSQTLDDFFGPLSGHRTHNKHSTPQTLARNKHNSRANHTVASQAGNRRHQKQRPLTPHTDSDSESESDEESDEETRTNDEEESETDTDSESDEYINEHQTNDEDLQSSSSSSSSSSSESESESESENLDSDGYSKAGSSQRTRVIAHRGRAIPRNDRTIPHRGRAIPRNDRTIPHKDRTIPHRGRAIPHNDRTIPHKDRTVPHKDRTIPHRGRAIPHEGRANQRMVIGTMVRRGDTVSTPPEDKKHPPPQKRQQRRLILALRPAQQAPEQTPPQEQQQAAIVTVKELPRMSRELIVPRQATSVTVEELPQTSRKLLFSRQAADTADVAPSEPVEELPQTSRKLLFSRKAADTADVALTEPEKDDTHVGYTIEINADIDSHYNPGRTIKSIFSPFMQMLNENELVHSAFVLTGKTTENKPKTVIVVEYLAFPAITSAHIAQASAALEDDRHADLHFAESMLYCIHNRAVSTFPSAYAHSLQTKKKIYSPGFSGRSLHAAVTDDTTATYIAHINKEHAQRVHEDIEAARIDVVKVAQSCEMVLALPCRFVFCTFTADDYKFDKMVGRTGLHRDTRLENAVRRGFVRKCVSSHPSCMVISGDVSEMFNAMKLRKAIQFV
jgi:hypothetical protein